MNSPVAKIMNLEAAASRILKAVSGREKVIVYGDSDLDGVCAAILAGEIVKNAGGQVLTYYFPNREKEGYGITKTALERLAPLAPALLVAVDLGIGNFEEVEIARRAGFSTVIIDHHEILDGVPQADIIVDPKQPGDPYPFKFFCAAGLVFELAKEVFCNSFYGNLRQSFAELAALATIADMMPREEDNIDIINEGMLTLDHSFRPGLRAFFETDAFFENDSRNFKDRLNKIIAVLNVRETRNGIPAAFDLLTTDSLEKSKDLIRDFLNINKIRRQKIDSLVAEIESRTAPDAPLIFCGSPDWEVNLLGTAASILVVKHKKPVFIYKVLGDESLGGVRSIDQIDSVALMKKCKELFISFGGHPKASGFRIKNENLEKFKACLIENINKK